MCISFVKPMEDGGLCAVLLKNYLNLKIKQISVTVKQL